MGLIPVRDFLHHPFGGSLVTEVVDSICSPFIPREAYPRNPFLHSVLYGNFQNGGTAI